MPYGGRDIPVEFISEIDTVYGDGTDTIYRDGAGRYYFERHREPEHGGFCVVHCISLRAAMLWALDLAGALGTSMREDVAAMGKEVA